MSTVLRQAILALALGTGLAGPVSAQTARTAQARGAPSTAAPEPGAVLQLDLERSRVEWTGTKFCGRGKHEGFVRISDARLVACTPSDCRGRFVLDMHHLEVTDIPASDPIPRRRLTEHLQSRDFFWTERYPDATFTLTGTRVTAHADSVLVTGELTLRNVTRALQFPARVTTSPSGEVHVQAHVTIDRQHWGIRYRFDPIRNELVDDDIRLVIVLVARPASTHAAPR